MLRHPAEMGIWDMNSDRPTPLAQSRQQASLEQREGLVLVFLQFERVSKNRCLPAGATSTHVAKGRVFQEFRRDVAPHADYRRPLVRAHPVISACCGYR